MPAIYYVQTTMKKERQINDEPRITVNQSLYLRRL